MNKFLRYNKQTFLQYQQFNKQSLIERKNSVQARKASAGFGQIDKFGRGGLYDTIYPWHVRRKYIIRRSLLAAYHWLLMLGVILLEAIFWHSWTVDCIRTINVWLTVYGILHFLKTLCTMGTLFLWICANDPNMQEVRVKVFC